MRLSTGFDSLGRDLKADIESRRTVTPSLQSSRYVRPTRVWLLCPSVIALLACCFISPAHATTSNGAKPVIQVQRAEWIVDQAINGNLCSTTYFSNSTLLSECATYVQDISQVANSWQQQLVHKSLTVSGDVTIQNELNTYEADLKAVLAAAGYTYTEPDVAAIVSSPAFAVAPDEITPDDDNPNCSNCDKVLGAGALSCGTLALITIPGGVACGLTILGFYTACVYKFCAPPTEPPKTCWNNAEPVFVQEVIDPRPQPRVRPTLALA
jgi:hypothetical protein